MDASLPSTSGLAASYEAGQTPQVDPMDLTIRETMDKLNGIRQEVAEVNGKVSAYRPSTKPVGVRGTVQRRKATTTHSLRPHRWPTR